LYILTSIDDETVSGQMRRSLRMIALPFLMFFLFWTLILLVRPGYAVSDGGVVSLERFKYLHNLLAMPVVLVLLAVGVVLVLLGLWKGARTASRKGFWLAAPGTVLVVMAVFFLAGFNGTAYYPSSTDLQSSLTIANSSSSRFTLQVMFWVSMLIPFVVAYIAFAWHAMDRKGITPEEMEGPENKY
jgi:cytochrome d ubiquinol oxidase subunit II